MVQAKNTNIAVVNNLLYITWNVDPVALSFGGVTVRWYGLLFAVGFLLAVYVLGKIFKAEKHPDDWADKTFLYIIVGVVIGARLAHVFFYDWAYYKDHLSEILMVWHGGLASHGGVLGGVIAMIILSKKVMKKPLLWLGDRVFACAGITAACIRMGNLMNSEIYGCETSLPWGFKFLRDFPKLSVDAVPVCHPTQIYEALAYFVMFLVLQFLYWKKDFGKKYTGMLFGIGFIWVFLFRFIVEFIKNDQSAFEADMILNMGQLLSIPFIIYGVYLVINAKKKKQ